MTRPLRLVVAAVLVAAAAVLTVAAAWPSHSDAGPTRFDARTATESALGGLMADYNPLTGRFTSDPTAAWWQSAAALDAVVRAEQALGSHAYDGDLIHSYETNLDARVLHIQGYRTNNYDDSGWWALLWLDAYQQTGDKAMLATAEDLDDYLVGGWTSSCGGGVAWGRPWIRRGPEKGVITNALFVTLSARLASVTGDGTYLARANAAWTWLHSSGLVVPGRLVQDHLDAGCRPVGNRWSYNQGETIEAALALGDVNEARQLGDAVVSSGALNPGGVLTDVCEPVGKCGVDGPVFKGVLASALGDLNRSLADRPYSAWLDRQAETAWTRDRTTGGLYGLSWRGPVDGTSFSRQASAVALDTATLGSIR